MASIPHLYTTHRTITLQLITSMLHYDRIDRKTSESNCPIDLNQIKQSNRLIGSFCLI
ncbi:hypothetical protein CROQUDRAFT_97537 [Cronartium quercuum f. sp. fusiforme G11]|uniref:Uncharacterized protein n=1 Tax=Cronartium quercuum f. sp. fusiforme G11 TaxID=708437 RepID=A0A9P6NA72_9BASI|nr:hypothetical protein CROQUDRAFT_97537 [Cronartium quercuum f. sp. fusiforme G11]